MGVEETVDQNTVRKAYIELVKKVHPDSGLPESSAERFQEVDEAFKLLQEKFAKNRRGIFEDDEEEVPDIRHTAPQHRQYLSFDGLGVGSPFQRQKQYQQIKAMKAQENVLKHRMDKSQADEKTIMKKGTYYKKHAIKTKYGFDRLVEDYIQEAMLRGDFNNLRGTGEPLKQSQTQNPYLDFTTHKLNKILLENGFTPEWITLQRDIREALELLKKELRKERAYYGEYPLSEKESQEWQEVLSKFNADERQINKNIDKYNLIVPIFDHQFFRVNLQKLSEQIFKDPTLPSQQKRPQVQQATNISTSKQGQSDLLSLFGSWF